MMSVVDNRNISLFHCCAFGHWHTVSNKAENEGEILRGDEGTFLGASPGDSEWPWREKRPMNECIDRAQSVFGLWSVNKCSVGDGVGVCVSSCLISVLFSSYGILVCQM